MADTKKFKIIDMTDEYKKTFMVCLEDYSLDMQEAGVHKECWYNRMKNEGLGVKLAIDGTKKVRGMIQYAPIEFSPAMGKDLYYIYCIWILPSKIKKDNFRKTGMGKALLYAAEDDARLHGAHGIVAWGITMPFFMKASWYKKQGYKQVDKVDIRALLWKPFATNAEPPKWIKQKKKPAKNMHPGKITITAFLSGQCPVQNFNYERAKKVAIEFKDKIVFKTIDTFDRNHIMEWGVSDAIYVEDKLISAGPPLSYEKIKKKVAKAVGKLK